MGAGSDIKSAKTLKILILEDQPTDAELVEHTLRKAGLDFLSERVATRRAFVEALDRLEPDIVLSDFQLPDLDGFAALKLVRDKDPHLPVIEVTGFVNDEAAVELIKAGANDFVLKDRLARLPTAIQRALAEADLRRRHAGAEHALLNSNRMLKLHATINSSLVRATTEQELLDEMCRVGVESGGYPLVWIGIAEHDEARTVRPVAWSGEPTRFVHTGKIDTADTAPGALLVAAAIRTGAPQVVQNIASDPGSALWRAALLAHGLKSCIALPLANGSDASAAIIIYAAEPDAFTPDEVSLLKEMAGDLAYGIEARRDRAGREAALTALQDTLRSTVQAVANAVETRDEYTAGHERHVAQLAVEIARELGLAPSLIEGLFLAGTIHDVGKLKVPAEYLSKPGKLTSLEYQIIQTHVQAGYDIIKDVKFPWPVARSILQHHERLDGSGYPNHLSGEAISIEGRILGVADVVDAMQSHRPYRPALGLASALAEIEQGKGRLYDPAVVDACLVVFREKGFKFS